MTRSQSKERIDCSDFLIALGMNLAFLVLVATPLWALDRGALVFGLAKGYAVLWVGLTVTIVLLTGIQKILRVNMYDHFDAYLISNAVVSGVLVAGWSAFVALSVNNAASGTPLWKAALLYFIGLVSSWMGFNVAAPFFSGSFYRLISSVTSAVGFVVFAFFPAAGRAVFGWFFAWFGFV